MSSFMLHQDVIYSNAHRARVLNFDPAKDSVEVEFADDTLIPPTMWVPVDSLRFSTGGKVVNPYLRCTRCNVEWKETMLARFSVWDCPQCGAKKEEQLK